MFLNGLILYLKYFIFTWQQGHGIIRLLCAVILQFVSLLVHLANRFFHFRERDILLAGFRCLPFHPGDHHQGNVAPLRHLLGSPEPLFEDDVGHVLGELWHHLGSQLPHCLPDGFAAIVCLGANIDDGNNTCRQ